MIPIVIGSNSGSPSPTDLGIPARPDILVVTRPGFEAEHLRAGVEAFDRFLFLKSSVRIMHPGFWDAVDDREPAYLFGRPSCWLGIYDSATLASVLDQIPPLDKEGSIWWESRIHDLLPQPIIWPDVTDRRALRIDTIDGAPELVIGNHLIEKTKGTVRCRRCPHWPSPGICPHVRARFSSSGTARRLGTWKTASTAASTSH